MNQALQQWRLAYNVEDDVFESLRTMLSSHDFSQENFSTDNIALFMSILSFVDNVNRDVSEQSRVSSITSTTSQLWRAQSHLMMSFSITKVNSFTSYVSFARNAEVASPSNVIVPKSVENFVWSFIIAQKKNSSISCVKCWAEKKKIYVSHSLCLSKSIIDSLFLSATRELHARDASIRQRLVYLIICACEFVSFKKRCFKNVNHLKDFDLQQHWLMSQRWSRLTSHNLFEKSCNWVLS